MKKCGSASSGRLHVEAVVGDCIYLSYFEIEVVIVVKVYGPPFESTRCYNTLHES